MYVCVCVRVRIFLFPVRASAVLAQLEPSVAELLGRRDLVLPFSGIEHFRKEVVFVGLAAGQHTHTLESLAGQSPWLCPLCLLTITLLSFFLRLFLLLFHLFLYF